MKLIAHRGGAGLRIENTLAAFENAMSLGAAGAELDVHLSRDGHVVVHHDDTLNPAYCRRPDGSWIDAADRPALSSLTLAQLHAFDIGTPRPDTAYAHRFDRIRPVHGQHIPRLREVIRQVRSGAPHFRLVIEIKASMRTAASRPWISLVDATLRIIHEEDFADRAILCSFDWGALRYAKRQNPRLPTWFTSAPRSWFEPGPPPVTDIPPHPQRLAALRALHASGDAPWYAGFDPRRYAGSHPRAVAAAGGDAWFPYHRDFSAQTGHELTSLGLGSAVWSVNLRDASALARVTTAAPDYLVTDYPGAGALPPRQDGPD